MNPSQNNFGNSSLAEEVMQIRTASLVELTAQETELAEKQRAKLEQRINEVYRSAEQLNDLVQAASNKLINHFLPAIKTLAQKYPREHSIKVSLSYAHGASSNGLNRDFSTDPDRPCDYFARFIQNQQDEIRELSNCLSAAENKDRVARLVTEFGTRLHNFESTVCDKKHTPNDLWDIPVERFILYADKNRDGIYISICVPPLELAYGTALLGPLMNSLRNYLINSKLKASELKTTFKVESSSGGTIYDSSSSTFIMNAMFDLKLSVTS